MSPGAVSERARFATVAAAIDPYRTRLAEDSKNFTLALLAMAEAAAEGGGATGAAAAEEATALRALAAWRRDAQHALKRVDAVAPGARGRKLAQRWLKSLVAALDLQRQGLSLVDPNQGAAAAQSAHRKIAEYHQLEERLDRVID